MARALDDPDRLAALRGSGALGFVGAQEFGRLTRLAAQLVRAPLTALVLVLADREVVVSVGGPHADGAGLDRGRLGAACRRVVTDDAPLVVENADQQRDLGVELSSGALHVGAFAGVPVRDPDGHALGAFCAVATGPRSWSHEAVRVLSDLAGLASVQLQRPLDAAGSGAVRLLQASEARRAAILSSALDAVVAMDADGRVVEWNDAAEKLFGYRPDEVLGRTVGELLVPVALRPAHAEGLRRHLGTGATVMLGRRMRVSALHADGGELPVELTITRSDIDGEPLFTAFLRDLRRDRAADEALRTNEQRMRAVVTAAPMVLFALDAHGRFTLSEGRGLDAMGIGPGELVGRSVFDVYAGAPTVLEHCRRALAGETFNAVVDVGDSIFDTSYYAVPPNEDGVDAVIGVGMDITGRRRSEARLEHLAYHDALTGLPNRAHLERSVGQALATARGSAAGAWRCSSSTSTTSRR